MALANGYHVGVGDTLVARPGRVMLTNWGFSVEAACDGNEAWQLLRGDDAPRLAILGWIMPGLDGTEVCRVP